MIIEIMIFISCFLSRSSTNETICNRTVYLKKLNYDTNTVMKKTTKFTNLLLTSKHNYTRNVQKMLLKVQFSNITDERQDDTHKRLFTIKYLILR